MAISRLFFEIGADSKQLNDSLKKAQDNLSSFGLQATKAGNAMIAKFDEALNPTKKLSEQIKLLEKAGKSQADIQKVMGDQIAYATKQAKAMGQPVDDLVKKYTSLESRLKSAGDKMVSVGKNMSMYVTAPIVALGAAAFKAGDDFDKGMNKIRVGTGAIGERLEALGDDMKKIWGTVPQGLDQISIAVADLNTRLDLSGEPLQQMATQMLNLSRITKTDITATIQGATRVFGQFSIAAEDQANVLDYLFKASQSSGISMTNLMTSVVNYGAQLKSFGFDLEESVALLAMWEKAGINAGGALAGLSMGLGKFAKAGEAPAEALKKLQQRMDSATNKTEAMNYAIEAFGTRSGAVLGQAMIEGKLNLEDFTKALEENTDTINAAANEAKSFTDRIAQLKEKAEKALLPIGEKLVEAFEKLQEPLMNGIKRIAGWVEGFSNLDPWIQKTALGVVGLTAAIGPLTLGIGGIAKGAAYALPIISALGPAFKILWASITGPVGLIAIAASSLIAFIATNEKAQSIIEKVWDAIKNAVITAINWLIEGLNKLPGVQIGLIESTKKVEERYHGVTGSWKDAGNAADDLGLTLNNELKFAMDQAFRGAKDYGKSMDEASQDTNKLKDNIQPKTIDALRKLGNQLGLTAEQAGNLEQVDKALIKQLKQQWEEAEKNKRAIQALVDSMDKLKVKAESIPDFIPVLDEDPITGPIYGIEKAFKRAGDSAQKSGETMNEFGRTVSTTLTNMTQDIAEKVTGWAGPFQDFAKAALSALMEGLFNPIMNQLTSTGNAIGNWLTGLLTGKSGGLGGLLGSIGDIFTGGGGGGLTGLGGTVLGGLLGGGGTAAAGTAGATLGGGMAGASPIAIGGGTAGGAAGGSFLGTIGGGLSTMGKAIWGALTNPVTAIIGAAAAAGFGIYKLIDWLSGPNAWEAMAKEVARDFGGVSISPAACEEFGKAFGVSEPEAWPIRKNITTSPQFLMMLAMAADQQNKMQAFLNSLKSVETSWGNYDFYTPFVKGMQTGIWADLNNLWLSTSKLGSSLTSQGAILTGKLEDFLAQSANLTPLQSGTNYVPETGPYLLHRGEAVIPANENRNIQIFINFNGPTVGDYNISQAVMSALRQTYNRTNLRVLTRA